MLIKKVPQMMGGGLVPLHETVGPKAEYRAVPVSQQGPDKVPVLLEPNELIIPKKQVPAVLKLIDKHNIPIAGLDKETARTIIENPEEFQKMRRGGLVMKQSQKKTKVKAKGKQNILAGRDIYIINQGRAPQSRRPPPRKPQDSVGTIPPRFPAQYFNPRPFQPLTSAIEALPIRAPIATPTQPLSEPAKPQITASGDVFNVEAINKKPATPSTPLVIKPFPASQPIVIEEEEGVEFGMAPLSKPIEQPPFEFEEEQPRQAVISAKDESEAKARVDFIEKLNGKSRDELFAVGDKFKLPPSVFEGQKPIKERVRLIVREIEKQGMPFTLALKILQRRGRPPAPK